MFHQSCFIFLLIILVMFLFLSVSGERAVSSGFLFMRWRYASSERSSYSAVSRREKPTAHRSPVCPTSAAIARRRCPPAPERSLLVAEFGESNTSSRIVVFPPLRTADSKAERISAYVAIYVCSCPSRGCRSSSFASLRPRPPFPPSSAPIRGRSGWRAPSGSFG